MRSSWTPSSISGWADVWRLAAALGIVVLGACSSAPRLPARPIPVAPAGPSSLQPPPPQPPTAASAAPASTLPLAAAPARLGTQATESPALAARFADPPITYRTPAFEVGRTAFTTNAELHSWMHALARQGDGTPNSTTIRLVVAGSSQSGVPLEALHFGRPAPTPMLNGQRSPRPTVLLVAQQHGDEPAGAEALIVIAESLANGALAPLLDRIDVVLLPRANPDGAAADRRTTASGIDVNRDHLLLRTPEAQAQAQLVREFSPLVVVDSHEFAALGRYVEKFGAAQRFDALIQYAMVANLPEFVTRASEAWFRQPLLQALKAEGLANEWYYTTSTVLTDKKVSMGGVQPDTGRNVNGLRNAVSFLIETRGGGLGRAHLGRRVHTHVVAIGSVLASAAAHVVDLQRLRRFVDVEVAAKACRGEVIVEAAETPSEYDLLMLDPQTGVDKQVTVAWDSALELNVTKRRARPCGYWLAGDQTDAALRLRGLGVQVHRLDEDGEFRGEAYAETGREEAARSDVRGSVADAGEALKLRVELVPALLDVRAGGYYVPLDQPLAHLVIAALEPDSQSSFAANRIIGDVKVQARVLERPGVRMTPLP